MKLIIFFGGFDRTVKLVTTAACFALFGAGCDLSPTEPVLQGQFEAPAAAGGMGGMGGGAMGEGGAMGAMGEGGAMGAMGEGGAMGAMGEGGAMGAMGEGGAMGAMGGMAQ